MPAHLKKATLFLKKLSTIFTPHRVHRSVEVGQGFGLQKSPRCRGRSVLLQPIGLSPRLDHLSGGDEYHPAETPLAVGIGHPEVEVHPLLGQLSLKGLNRGLVKLLVRRVRVASVEDGLLPLNPAEVSPRREAVLGCATEVRLTDFLGCPPEFADEGLLALGQGREVVNLELFKRVELSELVGSEVEFLF